VVPDDPADPIARQFLPDPRELTIAAGETADPIGDNRHEAVPGLIHRYPDRVLLKIVNVCAVYCRFCFRREMVGPGHGAPMSEQALDTALAYIRSRSGIWEVILSGGDPLVLSPRRIADVTSRLSAIEHVKVLRWHTRIPVVAPERITAEVTSALRSTGQAVYVALHANHPSELTSDARAACARLVDAGVVMVSQSVLLAGVNDDAATLEALMRAFVEARVKPYYLHQLDKAPGTSHFRTPIAHGRQMLRELRGRLSGLAQPTYILDIPGGFGKVPIGPNFIDADPASAEPGRYIVQDVAGCSRCYAERSGGVRTDK